LEDVEILINSSDSSESRVSQTGVVEVNDNEFHQMLMIFRGIAAILEKSL